MQDTHGILGSGGRGRIFGDRKLTAAANGNHHQQALKCPRCDSLNTKFCYYNNYNLSQPRHYCKNCRRYWTKGGVLRNVPVGGGCRKSKCSSKRKTASSAPPPSSAKEQRKSDSRSSSESTSANATDAVDKAQSTSVGSGKAIGSELSSSQPFKFSEKPLATDTVRFNGTVTPLPPCCGMNVNFEPLATADAGAGGMFMKIGNFMELKSGYQNQNLLGFGGGGEVGPAPFRMHQQNQVNHHHQDDQLLVQMMEGGGDHWVMGDG